MKKKLLAVITAAVLALSLVACGGSKESKTYKIGICQLVQHPALDAASQGFQDTLIEKLGEDRVTFDLQNAAGESATCATIVNGFVSDGDDLIMANATASLQASAAATADIPILGTSITDYATALEIDDWTGTVGNNISGTSDLAPLDEQANMIKELFPDAKTVGLLFCSAEPNSAYQVKTIAGYLKDLGIESKEYAFADSNDVASVVKSAGANSDVLYIPTDNTAASCTEAIAGANDAAPIVCGEEGICSGCGVATLSIDYYELGQATGEMAYKVLEEGADISEMAVEFAPNVTKKYNKKMCEKFGVTIPEGYEEIAE